MAYDRQLIVQFLSGHPSENLITDNAKAIDKRAQNRGLKSHIVSLPCGSGLIGNVKDHFRVKALTQELKKLTNQSRLYIQGDGDWESQKVADWGADEAADYLVACGMPAVKVISVLACEAGRDLGTTNHVRVPNSADSFASKFHKRLHEKHNIDVLLYARVYLVVPIGPATIRRFGVDKSELGRKATADEDDDVELSMFGRTKSKLRFKWAGGQQIRTWDY